MFTTHYTVSGMTCGNCVRHVTEELKELADVSSVDVQLDGEATIVASRELSVDEVRAAVAEAGDYTVVSR